MAVPVVYSVEEFTDEIVAFLQMNLPSAVAAQSARHAAADAAAGRTVPLGAPRNADYFPGGRGERASRFPYVEIACSDLTLENYSLGDVPDSDGTLVVVGIIRDEHARFDVLYRKVYRLGAALYACMTTRGCFPGSARAQRLQGAWRFNPSIEEAQEARDTLISGAMLRFEVATTALAP